MSDGAIRDAGYVAVVNRDVPESVLWWGTAATTAGAVASTHVFQVGPGRGGA
jgi:hypothetical protein